MIIVIVQGEGTIGTTHSDITIVTPITFRKVISAVAIIIGSTIALEIVNEFGNSRCCHELHRKSEQPRKYEVIQVINRENIDAKTDTKITDEIDIASENSSSGGGHRFRP